MDTVKYLSISERWLQEFLLCYVTFGIAIPALYHTCITCINVTIVNTYIIYTI